MTEPDGMYGEEIRHALSAVADLVVPAGDGLAKIRQRTSHRPPAFAWLYAYATHLPRALIVSFRIPASELVLMAKGQSTLPRRLRARLRGQFKPGSPHAWLRPALAAAGALVMVVAITLAVPGLRQTVSPSALNSQSTNSGSAGAKGTSLGTEQATGASRRAPTPSGSGSINLTVPPVGAGSGKCPAKAGSPSSSGGGGSSTYIPPVGSSPTESAGMNGNMVVSDAVDTTRLYGAQDQSGSSGTSHCSKSHSSSPSSSSSPTSSAPSSPSSSPPTSPSTSPTISPTGVGTPTPTGTAITDSPSPSDSDTGGMNP
jgi:hypothetical protein